MPDLKTFELAMRRAGVSNHRPVLLYDSASSVAAARGWWLLRYFGHDQVSVLNGGLAGWIAAGHPLEEGSADVAEGDFAPVPGGLPLLGATGAAELARTGVLIDARAPERFRGEQEPIDSVAGHIPGARNLPSSDSVGPSGRFLEAQELRRRFEGAGVSQATAIGAYCGSGVAAAHQVLALELAGLPAALYVGSWSDWITDRSRPVAKGPAPG